MDYTDDNAIISFCEKYDFLGCYDIDSYYKSNRINILERDRNQALIEVYNFNSENYKKESLSYFKEECKTYSFVFNLYCAICSNDTKSILRVLESHGITQEKYKYSEVTELLNVAYGIVMFEINLRIRNVYPALPMDFEGLKFPDKVEWYCYSLIVAIYAMLLLDITGGVHNKICESCGEPFKITRYNQRLCGVNCQKVAKQKRYRRHEKFLKLWNSGIHSEEELLKLIKDIDRKYIEQWIGEIEHPENAIKVTK